MGRGIRRGDAASSRAERCHVYKRCGVDSFPGTGAVPGKRGPTRETGAKGLGRGNAKTFGFFAAPGKKRRRRRWGGGGLRRRGGRSDAERFCRKAPRSYPDEATPSSLRGTCSATTEGAGTGFSWGAPGAGPRAARRSTRRETNDGFFGNSRGARGRDSCVCAVRRRRTRVPKKAKAPPLQPRFPQTPRMLLFSACAISSPQGFWRSPSASWATARPATAPPEGCWISTT